MKRIYATKKVILLIHLFTAIIPVLILGILSLNNSQSGKVVPIAISAILVILGLVLQYIASINSSKAIKSIIQTMNEVRNGKVNTDIEVHGHGEVQSLVNESNALIRLFNQVLSKVNQSTEEVRHLSQTVKMTSKEASDVAKNISESSEMVSEGANNQAEDAEECSRITTELVNSFEEVANSAELMTEKADTVQEMAEYGRNNISELIQRSKLSEQNMQDINNRISELSNMAQNIGHITTTITEIASQTNLLSLNASIEAARAGEMGKGFAVVAGEIKNLAQQSVSSSQEIKEIIAGIQNQVVLTTEAIGSTSEALSVQSESVNKTNETFVGISDAVKELFAQLIEVKKGIRILADFKQILSDSINNIAAVAQETAASTEEISSLMYSQINSSEILVQLSESFDSVIENLDTIIKKFNVEKFTATKRSFAIIPCIDIPLFYDTRDGAMNAAEKIGADIIWNPPTVYDPKVQAGFIEDAIKQGVSGIGVGPIDSKEVRESIKKALDKGIKVVCFDTDISNSGRNGFIGTDNYKAGQSFGELVAKKLNGKGKIIGTLSSMATSNIKERLEGFMEVIQKYPDIKIAEIESGAVDTSIRWKAIKKAMQEIKDFDCFVCLDSAGSFFAQKVKEELTIRPNMIVFDKTEDSEGPLRDGYLTILAQRPRLWGELAVRRLNELCNGKVIQDTEDTGTFEMNKNNMKIFMNK